GGGRVTFRGARLKENPGLAAGGPSDASIEISTARLLALRGRVPLQHVALGANENQRQGGGVSVAVAGPVQVTGGTGSQGCPLRNVRSQNDGITIDLRGVGSVGNGDNPGGRADGDARHVLGGLEIEQPVGRCRRYTRQVIRLEPFCNGDLSRASQSQT